MTDEETRNSQYWEERSEELSNDELKGVSGGVSGAGIEIPRVTNRQKKGRIPNDPTGSGSGVTQKDWEKSRGQDLSLQRNSPY